MPASNQKRKALWIELIKSSALMMPCKYFMDVKQHDYRESLLSAEITSAWRVTPSLLKMVFI
jgi:hypothetical protein